MTVCALGLGLGLTDVQRATSASQPSAAPTSAPTTASTSTVRNLHTIRAGQLICGAQPDGPAAFAELAARGVRTIISVDGVTPDLEGARRAGLRYVHIPLGYDGVPDEQRLRIARATRDLPGPVFVHCHHGKHRGPAAAAATAVTLGWWNAEEAAEFLKVAGTSSSYSGLYASVGSAKAADSAELAKVGDPRTYPERAAVADIVTAMVIAEEALENLKRIQAAGWRAPADHPDLVPAAEAARLAEQFRLLLVLRTPEKLVGTSYYKDAMRMRDIAQDLERSLTREMSASGSSPSAMSLRLDHVVTQCGVCHDAHRR